MVDGIAIVNTPPAIGDSEPMVEAPGDDTVESPGDDLDPIDEPDSTQDDIQQLNRLFVPSIIR